MSLLYFRIAQTFMNGFYILLILLVMSKKRYYIQFTVLFSLLFYYTVNIIYYYFHLNTLFPESNLIFLIVIVGVMAYIFFEKDKTKVMLAIIYNASIQILVSLCSLVFISVAYHTSLVKAVNDPIILHDVYTFNNICFPAIIICFFYIYEKQNRNNIDFSIIGMLTSILLIIYIIVIQSIESNINTSIFYIGLVFIFVQFIYSIYKLNNKIQNQHLLELQLEHSRTLLKQNDDIRKLNHDIVNHLHTIQTLIATNSEQQASEYANEIIKTYQTIKPYCDNDVINSILLDKLKDKSIDYDITISVPSKLNINDVDLATILFNIIDNALNGIDNDNKYLKISINYKLSCLYISAINSKKIDSSINNNYDRNHGHGMKIIKSFVKRNNGSVTFNDSGNRFEVSVLLPLEEK